MYLGSCCAVVMCDDVTHKMSISNFMLTINRSTLCITWEASGVKFETRVLMFRRRTLVGVPGLFLITVPRYYRQTELGTEAKWTHWGPDRPDTADVPDAVECQMMLQVALSSIIYLLILQWHVLGTLSPGALDIWACTVLQCNLAKTGCCFPLRNISILRLRIVDIMLQPILVYV